jgi:acetyl-CoA carboxylase carboxyl transferase subunit beta
MIIDKLKKRSMPKPEIKDSKVDIPVGKWVKCTKCGEIIYKEFLHENLSICPTCNYHFRLSGRRRIWQVVDEGTFKPFEIKIDTVNPLQMDDYITKLKTLRKINGIDDAVVCGTRKNRRRRSCNLCYGWKFHDGKYGNCCW